MPNESPIDPRGPQLIAYADRFGESIAGLRSLIDGQLSGVFSGVHVLPFFTPYDGADAGFDPQDHAMVDPRLGTWADVAALSAHRTVMADLIVNHMSTESVAFRDVRAYGSASRWSAMFLKFSSIFPEGATEAELAAIYRPRPGLPFTSMDLGGERRLVWTTFTPQQVDLDMRQPETWEYLTSVVDVLTGAGVTMIRLDAVGYAGKEAGTSCFLTDSTYALMHKLSEYAHARGAQILLEMHGHFSQQLELAEHADYVYDFALPPLVLHALTAHDSEPLARWLAIRPTNAVTVLDTHDGIGIIDAGPSGDRLGLLAPRQIEALVEGIHRRSNGESLRATGVAASNLDLYQVNCTFYDALGQQDDRYLLARLIQLFVPGIPQIYYVGLLAGRNDMDLLARSGVGRDINRHHYSSEEIADALKRPVVRRQLDALRFRATSVAFRGDFEASWDGACGRLAWSHGERQAVLELDLRSASFLVTATDAGGTCTVLSSDHPMGDELTPMARDRALSGEP